MPCIGEPDRNFALGPADPDVGTCSPAAGMGFNLRIVDAA